MVSGFNFMAPPAYLGPVLAPGVAYGICLRRQVVYPYDVSCQPTYRGNMPEKLEHLENTTVEPAQDDGESSTPRRREPVTRDRILRAALHVMDEEGLEAGANGQPGLEAMPLHNPVADKEAILEGILEVVMDDFEFPEETGDWEADVRAGARAWRRLMPAHPTVIALFAESKHPASSPERLRPMEWAFEMLGRGGLSEIEVVHAFRAFGGSITGA